MPGAALILPACNTEAMNLHLAEIAAAVEPAAHAVLLVDQAGWHMSTRLVVPANVTIITLPPKCPELNPVENVWQTVCSFLDGGRCGSHYETSEGCAGLADAEPHSQGTIHAGNQQTLCRS